MLVALILALNHRKINLLDLLGDGAGVSRTDDPAVYLPDRGDFRRRPGQKDLVRQVELVPGETLILHRQAQILGQRDDAVPGDARQDGRQRRRLEDAVLDDENVFPGSLTDIPVSYTHLTL